MPPYPPESTSPARRIRPDADDVSRRIIAPAPAASAPFIAPDIPDPIDAGPFVGFAPDGTTASDPDQATAAHHPPRHVVLVLSRRSATLHEGTETALSPVRKARFPMPMVTSDEPRRRGSRRPGTMKDVDGALAAYLAEHPAPVVIAGPQALVAAFREASTEVRALAGTVYGAFDDVSAAELRRRVRPVLRRYVAWREHEALTRLAERAGDGRVASGIEADRADARAEQPELTLLEDVGTPDVDELITLVLERGEVALPPILRAYDAGVRAATTRLVCLGDSFTEGMCDELRPDGQYLGWADRVARALAVRAAGDGQVVEYANLAVRGKLLDQVVAEQLAPALALAPTVTTFHAGPNDVLRRGTDLPDLFRRYDDAVRRVAGGSEQVLLFTSIGRAGGDGRLARILAERFARFNEAVRSAAARHGARVVDLGRVEALTDRRLWHTDRLHLNAGGHARVAAAVLEQLGVDEAGLLGGPPGWWRDPLAAPAPSRRTADLAADVVWARDHLLPWVARRLRGVSSGDGRTAKDLVLRSVTHD